MNMDTHYYIKDNMKRFLVSFLFMLLLLLSANVTAQTNGSESQEP